MRLTRLEIENFKCIGERQTIQIKPITLLFGPNSAGKSTILQAVQYFRRFLTGEFFKKSNKDNSTNDLDMGSFEKLVHRHDLSKTIRIRADVDFIDDDPDHDALHLFFPSIAAAIRENECTGETKDAYREFEELFPKTEFNDLRINYLSGDREKSQISQIAIAVEIKKSSSWLEVYINKEKILDIDLSIYASPPGKSLFDVWGYRRSWGSKETKLNGIRIHTNHFLLEDSLKKGSKRMPTDQQGNVYELAKEDNKSSNMDNKLEIERDVKESTSLEIEMKELYKEADFNFDNSESFPMLPVVKIDLSDWRDYWIAIVKFDDPKYVDYGKVRAPLDLVPKSYITREEKYSGEEGGKWFRLENLLSEILFASVSCVGHTISSGAFNSIQSLRPIPERGKTQTVLDVAIEEGLLQNVNFWLAERFKVNYQIRRFEFSHFFKEKAIDSSMKKLDENYVPKKFIPNIPKDYRTLLKLYDIERDIFLDIVDVGVGVSQLIPVVVEALSSKSSFVAMEQPELHLHPAIQVVLGDLFIESAKERNKTFLVETHSEHLILRLLRRIQETSNDKLPRKILELFVDDLSIIYVEPVRNKTRIKQLRIDEQGEFMDRWPNGFFDERAEELF